jgi:hypothetical protein
VRALWLVKGLGAGGAERLLALSARLRDRTVIGARLVLRSLPRPGHPRLVTTEHSVWGSHHRATRVTDAATARRRETHVAVSRAVRAPTPVRRQLQTRVIQYDVDVCEARLG